LVNASNPLDKGSQAACISYRHCIGVADNRTVNDVGDLKAIAFGDCESEKIVGVYGLQESFAELEIRWQITKPEYYFSVNIYFRFFLNLSPDSWDFNCKGKIILHISFKWKVMVFASKVSHAITKRSGLWIYS
jgi:hypothetical protein